MAKRVNTLAMDWRQLQPGLTGLDTHLPLDVGPFSIRWRGGNRWLMENHVGDLSQHEGDVFSAFRVMLDAYQQWIENKPKPQVYFIGESAEILGRVKIGTAIDPQARLRTLQTGSPVVLRILAMTPGGMGLEAHYHRRFKHQRRHGEWFVINKAILAEIERLSIPARETVL